MAMTAVDRMFPDEDRRRIAEAVREAEKETSGEIVVVISSASDEHPEVSWRAAFALAALVMLADLGYRHLAPFWLPWNTDALGLALVAAGVVGFLAASWPPLRRVLAGRDTLRRRARKAAEAAFATERVFETRERTGVLIFLSLFEHQVVVLPDTGIAAKAPEAAWSGVVDRIALGIKAGQPTEALVGAVATCAEILRAAGFTARPDDANEMPDGARVRSPGSFVRPDDFPSE